MFKNFLSVHFDDSTLTFAHSIRNYEIMKYQNISKKGQNRSLWFTDKFDNISLENALKDAKMHSKYVKLCNTTENI